MTAIQTIPRRKVHTVGDLPVPEADGRVLAADFHVEGAASWRETEWGLEHPTGRVVNVDHHAPLRSMRRYVSSANLALAYVRAHGPARPGRFQWRGGSTEVEPEQYLEELVGLFREATRRILR